MYIEKGIRGSEYIAIFELISESKTKVDIMMTAKYCSSTLFILFLINAAINMGTNNSDHGAKEYQIEIP